jgi:hypothetical protein
MNFDSYRSRPLTFWEEVADTWRELRVPVFFSFVFGISVGVLIYVSLTLLGVR